MLLARLKAVAGVLPEDAEKDTDTARIQQAIHQCAAGRSVELRESGNKQTFLSGPLTLRSGVTLVVDANTLLAASTNPRLYDTTPVRGDRDIFENVRVLGNQDTLYAGVGDCTGSGADRACPTARQYFAHCFIEGNVDFIFGDSKAVFDHCVIRSNSHSIGFITAQSESYPGQASGYVFHDCRLEAEPDVENVYLGRPWRPFATVVYMNTWMGPHIVPAGWREWHPGETSTNRAGRARTLRKGSRMRIN